VSEATLEIAARLFYAQHNTRTPMFAAIIWLVITIGLLYIFVDDLGVGGLALATTVGFTAQAALLLYLNRRTLGSLGERRLFISLARALTATAVMSVAIVAIRSVVDAGALTGAQTALAQLSGGRLDAAEAASVLFLALGGGIGLAVYLSATWLLGGRELLGLWRLLRPQVA
jgi:putative peptidoglycan lipid II flippase